jgi:hypothetical protein
VLNQSFGQLAPNATAIIRIVPTPGAGVILGLALLRRRRERRDSNPDPGNDGRPRRG